MVVLSRYILQQERRAAVGSDQRIEGAVVIKIADCEASPRKGFCKRRTCRRADILKSMSCVVEEDQGLFVGDMAQMLFDLVVRMAVHDEEVEVAVIIVIEEFHSPAAHQTGDPADAYRSGNVVERQVVVVFVNGIHLV